MQEGKKHFVFATIIGQVNSVLHLFCTSVLRKENFKSLAIKQKKLITVFIHTLSDLPSLIGNPLTPQAGPITF